MFFSGLFAEYAGSGASFMESPEGGMRSREHDKMPSRRKHAPQLRQPSGRLQQVSGQGERGHRIEGLAGGRRSEETVEREEPHGLKAVSRSTPAYRSGTEPARKPVLEPKFSTRRRRNGSGPAPAHRFCATRRTTRTGGSGDPFPHSAGISRSS